MKDYLVDNRPAEVVDPLEEVRRRRLLIDRLDAWLYEEVELYLGQRVLEVGCGHGNLGYGNAGRNESGVVGKRWRQHDRLALMTFQQDAGLRVTGTMTPMTVAVMNGRGVARE